MSALPPAPLVPRRWPALLPLALAALVGCAGLDEQQRKWIFQPGKATWRGAAEPAEGTQEVWIEFDSAAAGAPVRLHGLWLPQLRSEAPVLLYLHGARWDVRSSAGRMRRMHELGFSVLGIDYRGFGRSTDALPSEALATEDARAAWEWLAQRHPHTPRFIFGHSLGGAIAVNLATAVGPDARGLVLEATFPSIAAVFASMKWGWLPIGPLITQHFDSAARIATLQVPVLMVHGSQDRIIPVELGRALFERAPEPKRFVLVEGGSHHNTNALGQRLYGKALGELFGLEVAAPAGE